MPGVQGKRCVRLHLGLKKRGRHHSPPPKPVTAASALRDSRRSEPSLFLTNLFAVRIIPLKPPPNKAFSREKPAPEPVLVLGECSTTRAMAARLSDGSTLGNEISGSEVILLRRKGRPTPKTREIFLFNDLNSDIAGLPVAATVSTSRARSRWLPQGPY